MDLPNESDLTSKEGHASVEFASDDDKSDYPTIFSHPFYNILRFTKNLPPSKNGHSSTAHLNGNKNLVPLSNWDEIMGGYCNWGIPVKTDDSSMYRKMRTQFMYGSMGRNVIPYDPYEQVHRMMAAPLERKMEKYSQSDEFLKGSSQLYVILIELHPNHTKTSGGESIDAMTPQEAKDSRHSPKVWRLVVCHADTNLDSIHDQIIAPAMGWRRHYHGYRFVLPTSGATIGPKHCDAIDMMFQEGYVWDSEKYDLRHALRKPGQKLHYNYDLGDCWRHEITLVGKVDRGSSIGLGFFGKNKFVHDELLRSSFNFRTCCNVDWPLTITKSELLAGAINCPPEDSNGCDGMGNYGTILKRGQSFKPREMGLNWSEHGIENAFDFSLTDHQIRLDEAVSHRKNPTDGKLTYITHHSSDYHGDFRDNLAGKHRKASTSHGGASEILGKKDTSKICANCLKQQHSNTGLELFSCGGCKTVKYCGRQCQREHWKRGHKHQCGSAKKKLAEKQEKAGTETKSTCIRHTASGCRYEVVD